MPFLQNNNRCWSEFDFHMNSDVVYLTGDTFMPDTCSCTSEFVAKMQSVPDVKEDSVVISGNKDSMNGYMDEAIEENDGSGRTLFDECVANLSRDASFMLVADMHKVSEILSVFALICRRLFRECYFISFIYSVYPTVNF